MLTLIHMQSERGRVERKRRNESSVRAREQSPGPSGPAEIRDK
jgi:hypothetical protein